LGRECALGQGDTHVVGDAIGLRDPRFAPTLRTRGVRGGDPAKARWLIEQKGLGKR